MIMDAIFDMPAVLLGSEPRACVSEKSPLTNRIRRHFARIKAANPSFRGVPLRREPGISINISGFRVRRIGPRLRADRWRRPGMTN
jgi:hypothetical protein